MPETLNSKLLSSPKKIAELNRFFHTKLRSEMAVVEESRKNLLMVIMAWWITLLVIMSVSFWAIYYRDIMSLDDLMWGKHVFFIIVLLLCTIAGILVIYQFKHNYVSCFKFRIMKPLVKFISEDLKYEEKGFVKSKFFRGSQLFRDSLDRYTGEDYVSGKVGVTVLEFSEILAQEETKPARMDRGREIPPEYSTIFRGLFLRADFNKTFKGLTVVVPDFTRKKVGNFLSRFMQKNSRRRRGHQIKLENIEFNKRFNVFSDNQVEARYILTPAFMARVIDFHDKSNRPLYMSFFKDNIYIAIKTGRDMFEPSIFRTADNYQSIKRFYDDFCFAVGIVEDLNLNTRIWSKE